MTWTVNTDTALYGGRGGDGALPDTTVFRIDKASLTMDVIVLPFDEDNLPDYFDDSFHVVANSGAEPRCETDGETYAGGPGGYCGRLSPREIDALIEGSRASATRSA